MVLKRFHLLCILKILFGQLEELGYIAHIKIRKYASSSSDVLN